ncbi:LysR family transcriptional regulator [Streptomyces sp. NPDC095613]|uniref:LysR family transcriptional regulator n=1 Tax=Streptomyces sp. NPDC095613 TaxID=3155540 RepID=UPI0033243564
MFTLTQLTGFVAVAEELHFTRAAARLKMTQPPLSRQIQLLENELRVQLLDRTNRSVRLTPAGRAFLTEARRILRQSEDAALAVRQVSVGEAGTIAIGFTAASAHSMLGALLEATREAVPRAEIVLREMVTRDQLEALTEHRLDLGLGRPSVAGPDLTSRPAGREGLLAALPLGHALAERAGPLSVADFDAALRRHRLQAGGAADARTRGTQPVLAEEQRQPGAGHTAGAPEPDAGRILTGSVG